MSFLAIAPPLSSTTCSKTASLALFLHLFLDSPGLPYVSISSSSDAVVAVDHLCASSKVPVLLLALLQAVASPRLASRRLLKTVGLVEARIG
jgi:hypothetical protein